ncbi:hypothetical protein ACU635_47225 [[Actinomadura] parvosata]|uniref:hypothetical protein n=1 Tax=[Actinomadura] parvosata TaxID=1955412 RepID=UPI00406BEA63
MSTAGAGGAGPSRRWFGPVWWGRSKVQSSKVRRVPPEVAPGSPDACARETCEAGEGLELWL